jgi:hypothetical protein
VIGVGGKNMIDIQENPNRVRDDVLILITGVERLDPDVHDKIIKRLCFEGRYDYAVVNIEKEIYKKILSDFPQSFLQVYKLWDILQEVPEKYKYIVRARNDCRLDWNPQLWKPPTAKFFERYVGEIIRRNLTIGLGSFGISKAVQNLFVPDHRVWFADFIIVFRRDQYKNPYEVMDVLDVNPPVQIITGGWTHPHYYWCKLFKNKCISMNTQISLLRKRDLLDYHVLDAGLTSGQKELTPRDD